MKIEIAGHTDSLGTEEYNFKLALARTKTVMNFLIANGIPVYRLSNVSYGEQRPVATNETDEGRQLNRRVEFKIR